MPADNYDTFMRRVWQYLEINISKENILKERIRHYYKSILDGENTHARKGGVEKLNWQQAVGLLLIGQYGSSFIRLCKQQVNTIPQIWEEKKTHTHIYAICLYKVA